MELRQLEYVLGIVDHGGFTRAASALHISQPALSQAVRTLEKELGADLFVRTGRRVSLTPAGEAFVGPARQAVRGVGTARAAVDEVAGLRAGRLDLVCLPTLAVSPVADLIGRFRKAYPMVAVRLVEPEDIDTVASRVINGESEIGCSDLPIKEAGLTAIQLEPQEYMAIFPPGSVHGGAGRSIHVRSLARIPLITTPAGTSTRRLLDEALAAAGITASFAVETDHREAIAELVIAGAGAAILPRPVAQNAATRGVVVCDIRPRINRRIALIHRTDPLSPAARAFMEVASGRLGRAD
jgi:LysR family transcriptional regulator, carnitine catabolism transcriptional activator